MGTPPSDCFWAYLLPLIGPFLALLYAVSVLAFLASFHDCTWDSKTKSILIRIALFVAAAASSVGLCEGNASLWEAIFPVGLILALISAWLIRDTRVKDVAGQEPNPPSMKGKVVLVTGANTGIGLETVRQIALLGATVVLGCRSEAKARAAIEKVYDSLEKGQGETTPIRSDASSSQRLIFLPLDLSDFGSVRNAAKLFLEMNLPLHVLINNAGVMMGTKRMTNDGFELMLQANHLGHFLLTNLLLPKLQESGNDARVLNITSSTYELVNKGFDFEDMNCEKDRQYTLFGQYAQSKLANILFTKEITRRYPQMFSYAIHPGLVRTDVTRNMPPIMYYGNLLSAWILALLQKTPSEGAYSSVCCACCTRDVLPLNGSYIINSLAIETKEAANSEEDAKRLWEVSQRAVGL